jgi:hypothetical protein
MFATSVEKKKIGFQIFKLILPKLKDEAQVTAVFTKNFLSCLVSSFSKKDSFLYAQAKKTVSKPNQDQRAV